MNEYDSKGRGISPAQASVLLKVALKLVLPALEKAAKDSENKVDDFVIELLKGISN